MPYFLYRSRRNAAGFQLCPHCSIWTFPLWGGRWKLFRSAGRLYAQRDAAERSRQLAPDMLRGADQRSDRLTRGKLPRQREELTRSGDRDKWRIWGDLINAQPWPPSPTGPHRRS